MPLQNRVTPTGDIIATPHRGIFTGNRGIIHDPATNTLLRKRRATPARLNCACACLRWRRQAMAALRDAMLLTPPATLRAFSAGYRPALHESAARPVG